MVRRILFSLLLIINFNGATCSTNCLASFPPFPCQSESSSSWYCAFQSFLNELTLSLSGMLKLWPCYLTRVNFTIFVFLDNSLHLNLSNIVTDCSDVVSGVIDPYNSWQVAVNHTPWFRYSLIIMLSVHCTKLISPPRFMCVCCFAYVCVCPGRTTLTFISLIEDWSPGISFVVFYFESLVTPFSLKRIDEWWEDPDTMLWWWP